MGLTGVGLAKPKKTAAGERALMTSIRPPTGSKWTRGSSVRRPCQRAVESPSRMRGEGVEELVDREPDEQE